MGSKILTGVASVGAVAIALIVIDLENPPSLFGAAIKSLPYIGVWVISRHMPHSKRLPILLAGGLVIYLIIDAYVSFYAVRRPQSSTDPIAAFVVEIASIVIIPIGALITFALLRLLEGMYNLFRR